MQMASKATTPSLTAQRTPTQSQEYHLIVSGAISSEAITPAFCMIKGAFCLMRLDTEAIAGLPCLEEALDCFRDAGLLSFVTDKEHWNEELLLQFYATLNIRGYIRDTKTWVLEWMTGNVHHEAKALDIIELTGLSTPESCTNLIVNFTAMHWRASSISQNPT
jgi:hypothetical protein